MNVDRKQIPVSCGRLLRLCILSAVLAACVSPAFDYGDYVNKASGSLDAAISEIETTRITLQAVQGDRIFSTSADVTISGSEDAMGSIVGTFSAVQPPPSADDVQARTSHLLDVAQEAVTDSRIAVRRGDPSQIDDALQLVMHVSGELQDYGEQLK